MPAVIYLFLGLRKEIIAFQLNSKEKRVRSSLAFDHIRCFSRENHCLPLQGDPYQRLMSLLTRITPAADLQPLTERSKQSSVPRGEPLRKDNAGTPWGNVRCSYTG